MYTEEVNKIVSNSNDDKTLQPFDGIETYPHRTTWYIVCESERLLVCEAKDDLKMLDRKIRLCKTKIQSNECEKEMYVKDKERCEMFLKHVRAKFKSKMREYVETKYKNE